MSVTLFLQYALQFITLRKHMNRFRTFYTRMISNGYRLLRLRKVTLERRAMWWISRILTDIDTPSN